MKVRFFCDVPEWQYSVASGCALNASTIPLGVSIVNGIRIYFDVDLPPNCWKDPKSDRMPAIAENVRVIDSKGVD